MILSILGLVLVLSRNLKQGIDSLLSESCFLGFVRQAQMPIRIPSSRPFSIFLEESVAVSLVEMDSTPLRI